MESDPEKNSHFLYCDLLFVSLEAFDTAVRDDITCSQELESQTVSHFTLKPILQGSAFQFPSNEYHHAYHWMCADGHQTLAIRWARRVH